MRFWQFAVMAALFALSGCVQTTTLQTPFSDAEHAFALRQGSATVSGQAFLRRNDGIVVYGAGSTVYMIPATRYTQEVFEKIENAPFGVKITNEDPRLNKYTRAVQADGEGRFAFRGIGDGPYVLYSQVVWMAGNYRQGGLVANVVRVSGGQSVEAMLTR